MSKKDTQNKLSRLNKRLLEEIDLSEDRRQIIESLTMENRILDGELRKANAELEKYRIKDTYELAKFIEEEARKIAINKLEKIKKFNSQQVFSSKPIEDFINDQINELQEESNGRKI